MSSLASEQACLHIVSQQLSAQQWLECESLLGPDCAVLMIQAIESGLGPGLSNAVYRLTALAPNDTAELPPGTLDYRGFVELAAKFRRSRTW